MINFKQELLKESIDRTSSLRKTASTRNTLASRFTVETIEEFENIKEASLSKIAMPVAQGQLKLRNSSSNLKWWVVKPEGRVQQIVEEIKAAFKPFLYAVGKQNKRTPINPQAYFPNGRFETSKEQPKIAGEPQCSLRVEFGFTRQLVPTDKEFQGPAQQSINSINQILPGFKEFISTIESSRLTLNPFFHKISPSRAAGTLISKGMTEGFLQSEHQRYQSDQIRLPDGTILSGAGFYQNQMRDMQNGVSMFPTMTDSFNRIYDTAEHLKDIHDPMPLVRAVLEKIRQGYSLDTDGLKADIEADKGPIKQDASHAQQQAEQFERLSSAYKKAITPLRANENPEEYETLWTDKSSQRTYRGFKVMGNKSAKVPVGLEVNDIKLILKNLTIQGPGVTQTFLYPDQFVVPGASMKYQSNGWDSHPTNVGSRMPLLPSMRAINGNMEYDFDQINLGRIHLSMYGKQVKTLLAKFGPKCKEWFTILRDPSKKALSSLYQDRSNTIPLEAIEHILGAQQLQRTNAETLAENLMKYPTYQALLQRLQYSLSSKSRGTTSIQSDAESYLDEEGFALLQRWGYYVSKMMDLVSGLMHRACEEGVNTRLTSKGQPRLIPERFYGRRYSTSGGKASHGSVVVGIRYAFNSVELGSHDIELQRVVREKRKTRGWGRPGQDQPEVVRQTRHHQRGDVIDPALQPDGEEAIVKLVENMQFWIGVSSSDADFKRTVAVADDWPSLLAKLHTLYPNIDREDGLAIFDPLNMNIQRLQNAISRTIAATLEEIKSAGISSPIEVVLQQYDGNSKVIDRVDADAEANELSEQDTGIEEKQPEAQTALPPAPVQPPSPQPATPGVAPAVPGAGAPTPQTQPTTPVTPLVPQPGAKPPSEKKKKPKPFPLPAPDYITKKKLTRSLFRKGIDPNTSKLQHAEVISNLVKVADRLDSAGQVSVANKIDLLIKKLSQE